MEQQPTAPKVSGGRNRLSDTSNRLSDALNSIAPPGLLIGGCFVAAGVVRLIAVPTLDSAEGLFTVLSVIDAVAMAGAFALFALSYLTGTSRPARSIAWLLAGLYLALLVLSPFAIGDVTVVTVMGILSWVTIAAGLVFGVFIMRARTLPVRIQQLPLVYFALSIVVAMSFLNEPTISYLVGAVILVLFGAAFIGFLRVTTRADGIVTVPRKGWYKDPADQATFRWWDGSGWTGHTSTGDSVSRAERHADAR